MTILQKRAWAGLIISAAMLTSLFVLLRRIDADVLCLPDSTHYTIYGILVVGGLFYGLVVWLTRSKGEQIQEDERDAVIRRKARNVQLLAIFFTTLLWANGLTEMYHEECVVPVKYIWFIYWSLVLVSVLGQAAGIVIGYWRMNRHE